MYQKVKSLQTAHSASMMCKNLQVVSFDSEWKEVYLGTIRRESFTAICPNDVPKAVAKVEVHYKERATNEPVVLTSAKWCPMENCTVLVVGRGK